MPNPGECDDATNAANQTAAKQMVGSRLYALTDVLVVGNDTTGTTSTITVMTGNDDGSTNTDVLSWSTVDDLWAACPSSLPSSAQPGDAGPPPPAGTSGQLYLSDSYLKKRPNITTFTRPKWPLAFGADDHPCQDVRVWPTKIVVYGVELEDGIANTGQVDLLDSRLARRGQQLTIDHLPLTLSLTEEGSAGFYVTFSPALPELRRAASVIEGRATSPDALVAAWRVVSNCLANYRRAIHPDIGARAETRAILLRLLPGQSL